MAVEPSLQTSINSATKSREGKNSQCVFLLWVWVSVSNKIIFSMQLFIMLFFFKAKDLLILGRDYESVFRFCLRSLVIDLCPAQNTSLQATTHLLTPDLSAELRSSTMREVRKKVACFEASTL